MGSVPRGSRSIVIANVFADDNRGGAAITARTVDIVEEALPGFPISALSVRTGDPSLTHRFLTRRFPSIEVLPPPVAVSGRRFGGTVAVMRSLAILLRPRSARSPGARRCVDAVLVVSKGGYIFVDRGGFRGVLSLWLTSLPLILAARAGRPTAVVATSIGPFEQRLSRVTSSWILKRVGLVLARDPRSYEEALNLGLRPERVMEVPDVVFGMRGPTPDEVAAMTARYGLSTGRYGTTTVQRGPAAGPVDRRHLHELAVAMMRLLETGYIDRLAIVVQVDGDTSDLAQSRTLAEEIHDERVVLISDDLGPEELIALYGGAAFAVCGRLHSAIFSLIAGTPSFAVAMYKGKTEGVLESLGLSHLLIPYSGLRADALTAQIEDVLSRGVQGRREIERAVEEARKRLDRIPGSLAHLVDVSGANRQAGGVARVDRRP